MFKKLEEILSIISRDREGIKKTEIKIKNAMFEMKTSVVVIDNRWAIAEQFLSKPEHLAIELLKIKQRGEKHIFSDHC